MLPQPNWRGSTASKKLPAPLGAPVHIPSRLAQVKGEARKYLCGLCGSIYLSIIKRNFCFEMHISEFIDEIARSREPQKSNCHTCPFYWPDLR